MSSWFGGDIFSTVDVPYSTEISFHISGEDKEAKIPVNEIQNISLSK